jgi:hypothetical protein
MTSTRTLAVAGAPAESAEDVAALMNDMGARAREAAGASPGPTAPPRTWRCAPPLPGCGPPPTPSSKANALDVADLRAAGATPAVIDRGTLTRAHRGDGRRPRGHRRPPRPGRRGHGRMAAAQRPGDPAGAHAHRGHRRHLREPAECHRRCRRPVPEGRQRGDPARRLRQLQKLRRHPCLPRRGAGGRRAAGRRDPAGPDPGPRRGGRDAQRPRAAPST